MASALQFFNSQGDIDLYTRLYNFDGISTTTKLPSATNIIWTISGLDNDTLTPIDSDFTNIDYWFTHKWEEAEYTVGNIQSVSGAPFYFQLLPLVDNSSTHLGISPIISGGGSIQFYISGVNTNYSLSGRHYNVDNYGEEYETWGDDSYKYLNMIPPSGVLSGYWIKDHTLSGTTWGEIDYSNGKCWLDLTNIPDGVFETNHRKIYAKWEGNYDIPLNQSVKYVSAANFRLYSKDDTTSYYIAATGLSYDQPYPTVSFNFIPRRIDILENNYNFTNATLSAVYLQRNINSWLSDNDVQNQTWPYNLLSGRAICWKTSQPGLSVYLPLSGNILWNLSLNQLSGWSRELENIQLTANKSSTTNYQVSVCFPEDTLGYRTTAIYDFIYAPILNEDLQITVLSATLYNEILQVNRKVVTDATVDYVAPTYPLIWTLTTPAMSSYVQVCTGIDKDDLENTSNYVCRTNWTSLTGLVGLLSSQPLSNSEYIVTGYENVYGSDYIRLNYNTNPDYIYTFSVHYSGSPYSGFPLDTHTFQVYSTPNNIYISAVNVDLESQTRSLTAKVMNDRGGGTYVPLHPMNKIRWSIPTFYESSVTARQLDGQRYLFDGTLANDTLIFDIETSTFDLITIQPVLCTILIQASAYDTYNIPTSFITTTSMELTIDTFPASALFFSYLQVNQESSLEVTDMWREWSASNLITAIDHTTINGTNVITGTRLFTLGDGRSLTESMSSFTYPTTGVYTIHLLRSGISASGWLSAHKFEDTLDLHLITRFLSSDFIVYPTYVFTSSSTQAVNTLVDPITSYGVQAYDVGHTEPFILSASETLADRYVWAIGNTTLPNYISPLTYNHNTITPATGLPITLKVYNAELSEDMPPTYKSDIDGSIQYYPNMKQTDNSSILFEHLKMDDYVVPTITITEYTDNLVFPFDTQVSARSERLYPTNLPISADSYLCYWMLSTPNWIKPSYTTLLDDNIILGVDDTIAGVIKYGATYPLAIVVTEKIDAIISNSFAPNDWGISSQTVSTIQLINYQSVPQLIFYPATRYNIINTAVILRNLTEQNPIVSSFYINDGYHTTNYFINGFNNFTTSYPEIGTYTLSITGNTNKGSYKDQILNCITIISAYEDFDDDVSRVFGATELVLPVSFETLQIPPNEWITSQNFNKAINSLNDNLNYLRAMTQFYSLPPIADDGWMGFTYTGITSSLQWFNPLGNNYTDISLSLENIYLSGVNDVTFRNGKLYIVDSIGLKMFDDNYIPTHLQTLVDKTFGDSLGLTKAVSIDSNNRIYVLDQSKNRVIVYGPYIDATNPRSTEFLFEWGGLGSSQSKLLFNNPNDLVVDASDLVWVADTGNKCLKKYTRTGGWLQTIDVSDKISGTTTTNGGIISFDFDSERNIHILTKDMVYQYDQKGLFLNSYTFLNTKAEIPQKIRASQGNGFLYICLQTSIVKVLENGNYSGIFANTVTDANFTSLFHTSNKELLVANNKTLLRYIDFNRLDSSAVDSVQPYIWTDEQINVKADENVEHWVINKVLQRFWDNLELFRRSLTGEIAYGTDSSGRPIIVVQNFTPTQYADMALTVKSDVFIGLNEIVSNTTLNRCFRQFYNMLDNLRKYV